MLRCSVGTGAHSPRGGGSGPQASMLSRAHSRYSSMAGSPEKSNTTMQENGKWKTITRFKTHFRLVPSLQSTTSFAGVGSNMRMSPLVAQFPTMAGDDEGYSRGYPTSGFSAVGSYT